MGLVFERVCQASCSVECRNDVSITLNVSVLYICDEVLSRIYSVRSDRREELKEIQYYYDNCKHFVRGRLTYCPSASASCVLHVHGGPSTRIAVVRTEFPCTDARYRGGSTADEIGLLEEALVNAPKSRVASSHVKGLNVRRADMSDPELSPGG